MSISNRYFKIDDTDKYLIHAQPNDMMTVCNDDKDLKSNIYISKVNTKSNVLGQESATFDLGNKSMIQQANFNNTVNGAIVYLYIVPSFVSCDEFRVDSDGIGLYITYSQYCKSTISNAQVWINVRLNVYQKVFKIYIKELQLNKYGCRSVFKYKQFQKEQQISVTMHCIIPQPQKLISNQPINPFKQTCMLNLYIIMYKVR